MPLSAWNKRAGYFLLTFLLLGAGAFALSYRAIFQAVKAQRLSGFQNFEQTYVINLPQRTDRLDRIRQELRSVGINNFTLVAGVKHPCGALGCSLSHIIALQKCLDSSASNCLIIEDDFEFSVAFNMSRILVDKLFRLPSRVWDVVFLSANIIHDKQTRYGFLRRVLESQTTSGYVVSKQFAPELLKAFTVSARHLANVACDRNAVGMYAVDMYMKRLQPLQRFYVFHPKLGKQREDFSDIEKTSVNYGV